MKKLTKILSLALCFTLATIMLVACGGGKGGSGISQEDWDQLMSEKDALLEALKPAVNETFRLYSLTLEVQVWNGDVAEYDEEVLVKQDKEFTLAELKSLTPEAHYNYFGFNDYNSAYGLDCRGFFVTAGDGENEGLAVKFNSLADEDVSAVLPFESAEDLRDAVADRMQFGFKQLEDWTFEYCFAGNIVTVKQTMNWGDGTSEVSGLYYSDIYTQTSEYWYKLDNQNLYIWYGDDVTFETADAEDLEGSYWQSYGTLSGNTLKYNTTMPWGGEVTYKK